MTVLRLGIDLGGTKTEGVVLRPDGSEAARLRRPTIQADYAACISTIGSIVAELEGKAGLTFSKIGVGVPGSMSPRTGLIRNANSVWLNGKPLQDDLSASLGKAVRISNDANCLALSEIYDGNAKDARSVFSVILGTGVGGGLVINKEIVTGANGLAGEWGHIPLVVADGVLPHCYCGQVGCMEQYLSGPAILRDYFASGGYGAVDAKDVADLANGGESIAQSCLARHLQRLGRGLATIVNVIDPDVIVLGGGVSNLHGIVDALPGAIKPYVFADATDEVEIDVRLARWGDSSGVRGAARLWGDEEHDSIDG